MTGRRSKPEMTASERIAVTALLAGVAQVLCTAATEDRLIRLFRSWAKILRLDPPELTPTGRSVRHYLSNADIHIALQRIEAASLIYRGRKTASPAAIDAEIRLKNMLLTMKGRM